jgi:DNA polymerase-1
MAAKTKLPVVTYSPEDVHPDQQHARKGIVCAGCPLEKAHRLAGFGSTPTVDLMLVSESPSWASIGAREPYKGRGGMIIRRTLKQLRDADERDGNQLGLKQMTVFETYAVQCQSEPDDIKKPVIERCSNYLKAAIEHKQPKVILIFGAVAFKALGFKGNFTDSRGRILFVDVGGKQYPVLPTFSSRNILAKDGLFALFRQDFIRAVRIASGRDDALQQTPIEELTKDYKIPKTVEEVKAVCQEIIDYAVQNTTPQGSFIAIDTETNTLHPERPDAKVLCISIAWDVGKSTAIPLWHPNSPFDVEEILPYIRAVLESPKPKVLHNGKFDLKFLELRHGLMVNNVRWDTLGGEHLLIEDQQKAYGLKVLARSYFPQFAQYADHVHEVAAKHTDREEAINTILAGMRKGKTKALGFEETPMLDMTKKQLEQYLYGSKKSKKKRDDQNDSGYERVPIDELLLYAAIDTDLTRRLLRNQWLRIRTEGCEPVKSLMYSHVLPASRALGRMEFDGIRVDRPYLEYLDGALGKVIEDQEREMLRHWDNSWRPDKAFNSNSVQDVGFVLFSQGTLVYDENKQPKLLPNGKKERKLRYLPGLLEPAKNEKSGLARVDKKTLRAIVEHHNCPFTKALLVYRAAHKAKTGFLEEIKILSERDGRMHTNFHLTGTSTGRLSSSGINMQNIPSKLAGYNIKKLFIPDDPESDLIVNLDYKGAEVRIFAAYSQDPVLIDVLERGLDVHWFFVQEVYGIPYEEGISSDKLEESNPERYRMLKQLRTNVKRVVFGILYGAGEKTIAETAGIPVEEARRVIALMFAKFPSLNRYVTSTKGFINRFGYVDTFFNRRRRFPLHLVNSFFRSQAERRGVNMRIQSTSSDIVLGQLIEVYENIHQVGGRLALTVHDSIVAVVKKKYVAQLPDFFNFWCVKRVQERYPWLPVTFACDIEAGPSYGELIALDKYIKKEQERQLSEREQWSAAFDEEILDELREGDEQKREEDRAATYRLASGG